MPSLKTAEPSLGRNFVSHSEPLKGLPIERREDGEELWRDQETIDGGLRIIEGMADAFKRRQ